MRRNVLPWGAMVNIWDILFLGFPLQKLTHGLVEAPVPAALFLGGIGVLLGLLPCLFQGLPCLGVNKRFLFTHATNSLYLSLQSMLRMNMSIWLWMGKLR